MVSLITSLLKFVVHFICSVILLLPSWLVVICSTCMIIKVERFRWCWKFDVVIPCWFLYWWVWTGISVGSRYSVRYAACVISSAFGWSYFDMLKLFSVYMLWYKCVLQSSRFHIFQFVYTTWSCRTVACVCYDRTVQCSSVQLFVFVSLFVFIHLFTGLSLSWKIKIVLVQCRKIVLRVWPFNFLLCYCWNCQRFYCTFTIYSNIMRMFKNQILVCVVIIKFYFVEYWVFILQIQESSLIV